MSPASSSSLATEPFVRDRRRSRLLLSACALLAVGAGINLHRHLASPEPTPLEFDDEELSTESRFVAYMEQPEEPPELEQLDGQGQDEAGGSGQRHKGEEGRMGFSPRKGLYAMKAPRTAMPQLSRNYDPAMAARNAGILGMMQQESGHFLASPYGAAFAVGNDDESVWGGQAGLQRPAWSVDDYREWLKEGFSTTADDATSTFSIDVDTGAYSLVRQQLVDYGSLPPPGGVRIEELINYFDYDYPEPSGEVPVSITSEVGPCPWDSDHRLVHVGLQGRHVAPAAVPPRNLVFLVDVSGSMGASLPLVISSLTYLSEQLGERDTISIVVYAGSSGTVLPPTSGADKATILGALERLQAGGSTNGGEGIQLAYALAREHFVEGGINRVMLATDGDFNVGLTDHDALVELIEHERRSGVFLSVLGFGGSNYQDVTMEQLADHGNGNYAYIDGLAEARKVLVEQAGSTLITIAKDVKIQVELDPAVVKSYRLVGYDNRVLADRDFADDTKDAGEIGAGHTVTALYEVELEEDAAAGDPLMELRLRYKEPDGARSKLVEVAVRDEGRSLAQSSDDFRFSAAVAGFGLRLQGAPSKTEPGSLEDLRDLARDARGGDHHCRRAELVSLVERASGLMGHPLEPTVSHCVPTPEPPPTVARPLPVLDDVGADAAADASTSGEGGEPFDWKRFVVEVLYLLPPLLALPLFVMALRRPRRRRRD